MNQQEYTAHVGHEVLELQPERAVETKTSKENLRMSTRLELEHTAEKPNLRRTKSASDECVEER